MRVKALWSEIRTIIWLLDGFYVFSELNNNYFYLSSASITTYLRDTICVKTLLNIELISFLHTSINSMNYEHIGRCVHLKDEQKSPNS